MNRQLIDSYREKLLKSNFEVKRSIYEKLKGELLNFNIILIGLRQLGKTILIEQLAKDYLEISEEVSEENTTMSLPTEENFLYLNLKSFSNVSKESVQNEINGKGYKIVLIDEIQTIEDWSDLAQVLADLNQNTRFILTGSNASSLSRETAFQRYKIFNIYPLNFDEYKKIWNDDNFHNYLYYGSYPKTERYSSAIIQYKEMVADLIIDKVASEDNEGIRPSKLRNFTKSICNYIGNEINQSNLSLDANLVRPTTIEYIKALRNSMLIKTISKFKDKNKHRKEKVYFTDKSMLPYFIDQMGNNEIGALIENLVFLTLCEKHNFKYGSDAIQYYRNEKNKEIDFILEFTKELIEVKFINDLDCENLSNELNFLLIDDVLDYKKTVITKNSKGSFNGWEFIPLIEYLGGK